MTSILFSIETIYYNYFRYNHPKKKTFSEIFCVFSKSIFDFEHFWKKDDALTAVLFLNLRTSKNVVR